MDGNDLIVMMKKRKSLYLSSLRTWCLCDYESTPQHLDEKRLADSGLILWFTIEKWNKGCGDCEKMWSRFWRWRVTSLLTKANGWKQRREEQFFYGAEEIQLSTTEWSGNGISWMLICPKLNKGQMKNYAYSAQRMMAMDVGEINYRQLVLMRN